MCKIFLDFDRYQTSEMHHQRVHTAYVNGYICPVCRVSFLDQTLLINHWDRCHLSTKGPLKFLPFPRKVKNPGFYTDTPLPSTVKNRLGPVPSLAKTVPSLPKPVQPAPAKDLTVADSKTSTKKRKAEAERLIETFSANPLRSDGDELLLLKLKLRKEQGR